MTQVLTESVIFIHVHGKPGIVEVKLPDQASLHQLEAALTSAGIAIDGEVSIFLDDSEHHEHGDRHRPLAKLQHGSRVHVTHCKQIKTTVNFLDSHHDHEFAPGTKLQAVKDWAVKTFRIDPKDAAAHVLRLCNTTQQPATDTRLIELVHGHACDLCFDLVPDKRVEG